MSEQIDRAEMHKRIDGLMAGQTAILIHQVIDPDNGKEVFGYCYFGECRMAATIGMIETAKLMMFADEYFSGDEDE